MADLKATKDKSQRSELENEQKWVEDKAALEEKLADTKKHYEEQLAEFRKRLQSASSDKDNKQVEELNKEWQTKCDDLTTKNKKQREMINTAEKKVEELNKEWQTKCDGLMTKNEKLQEVMKTTEQKYQSLRTQAAAMKQQYENKITELENEHVSKVKLIMNSVYHKVKECFDPDKTYKADEINSSIMTVIKHVTLRMMQEEEEVGDVAVQEGTASSEPVSVVISEERVTSLTASAPREERPKSEQKTEERDKGEKNKVSEQTLANVISAMTEPTTGDKGNPYYAKELSETSKEKESASEFIEEPMIVSSISQTTSAARPKSHDEKSSQGHTEASSDNIAPVTAYVTGGHGNPYYAEELKKNAEEKKISDSEDIKSSPVAVGDVIKPAVAPSTGGHGNPYYAAELNKTEVSVEEPIISKTASPMSAAVPSGAKPEKKLEDHQAEQVMAEVIKPIVSSITGDKGNPYYAAELTDQQGQSDGTNKDKPVTVIAADVIKPGVAPITGDKGNPYYAAELVRSGESDDVPVVVSCKEAPHVTGGWGNPDREEEILAQVEELTASKEDKKTDTPEQSSKEAKKTDTPKESSKESKKTDAPKESSKEAKKTNAPKESSKEAKKTDTPKESSKEAKKTDAPKESSEEAKKTDAPKESSEEAKKTDAPKESSKEAKKTDAPKESSKETKKTDTPKEASKEAKKPDTQKESSKEAKKSDISKEFSKEAKKPDTPKESSKESKKTDTSKEFSKEAKKTDTPKESSEESKKTDAPKESSKEAKKTDAPKESSKEAKKTDAPKDATKMKSEKSDDFDDDLKPKPPPLFDDDDDDDLNWLK